MVVAFQFKTLLYVFLDKIPAWWLQLLPRPRTPSHFFQDGGKASTDRDRDCRSSVRHSVWRQELFLKLVRSEFGCFEGNEWPRHPKSKLIPPLYLDHDDDDEGGNWGHHSLVFALRLFGVEIRNYPVKYIALPREAKIDALGGPPIRWAQEKSLNK